MNIHLINKGSFRGIMSSTILIAELIFSAKLHAEHVYFFNCPAAVSESVFNILFISVG